MTATIWTKTAALQLASSKLDSNATTLWVPQSAASYVLIPIVQPAFHTTVPLKQVYADPALPTMFWITMSAKHAEMGWSTRMKHVMTAICYQRTVAPQAALLNQAIIAKAPLLNVAFHALTLTALPAQASTRPPNKESAPLVPHPTSSVTINARNAETG